MKLKIVAIVFFGLFLGGCRGLSRIIDGPESPDIADPALISGQKDALGAAPIFPSSQPTGTTKTVYYDYMPSNFKVDVAADPNSTVDVFVKDFSGFWFRLNTTNHSGYIYKFNAGAGVVEYTSLNPQLDLSLMKVYCIYQYR